MNIPRLYISIPTSPTLRNQFAHHMRGTATFHVCCIIEHETKAHRTIQGRITEQNRQLGNTSLRATPRQQKGEH